MTDTETTDGYVDWVKHTIGCTACGVHPQATKEFLFNANLPERLKGPKRMSNLTVVPQVGFLGSEYHSQPVRLLVLGKNPGGGGEPDMYYGLQSSIVDSASLRAASPLMIAEVRRRWKPLIDMKLFDHVRPEQIAYANQILCRTTLAESKIEGTDEPALRDIYDTCVVERVLPVISVLRPHHIIAIGEKKYGAWPPRLAALLRSQPDCASIRVHGVVFPFGSHKEKSRAQLLVALRASGYVS